MSLTYNDHVEFDLQVHVIHTDYLPGCSLILDSAAPSSTVSSFEPVDAILERFLDAASSGVYELSVSCDAIEEPLFLLRGMSDSLELCMLAASSIPATVSIAERNGDPWSGCANTFEMLVAGCAASRELRHFGVRLASDERELWRLLWPEEDIGV